MARDRAAVIVIAVGHDRPAIVLPRLDEVQFVAAGRAVFEIPQPALRIELQAQHVAVAIRPDLCGNAATIGGGIVAALDVGITSGSGGVTIGASVSGGRDVAVSAGSGDLMLGGNVTAGNVGVYAAPQGSVLQPSAGVVVAGGAASFLASGSVGAPGSSWKERQCTSTSSAWANSARACSMRRLRR